jgi:hypothetical protein
LEPANIPAGAKRNGYQSYFVREVTVNVKITEYKRAEYILPDGSYLIADIPPEIAKYKHFGPGLRQFVLYQYHANNVTQNKVVTMLHDLGLDISKSQINDIIIEGAKIFKDEYDDVYKTGMETAKRLESDDTVGFHKKERLVVSVIGNEFFTILKSSYSKSRLSFLFMLQRCDDDQTKHQLGQEAFNYLKLYKVAPHVIEKLKLHMGSILQSKKDWEEFLYKANINLLNVGSGTLTKLREAALISYILESMNFKQLGLTTDGAPQFKNIFKFHQLCWLHAIRGIERLIAKNDEEAAEIKRLLDEIWLFYQDLKSYKDNPTAILKDKIEKKFDKIFLQSVENDNLLCLLLGIYKLKKNLLCVLEFPDLPIHNNGSERAIRPQATRRKISGPTRSDDGRSARDVMLSLQSTAKKLDVSFWKYIGDKLSLEPFMSLAAAIKAKIAAKEAERAATKLKNSLAANTS